MFILGHPHFLNQLSQGLDVISMAGEWLAATANTNMFTYEIAPVFIMMEHEVMYHLKHFKHNPIKWHAYTRTNAVHDNIKFIFRC